MMTIVNVYMKIVEIFRCFLQEKYVREYIMLLITLLVILQFAYFKTCWTPCVHQFKF